MFTSLTKINKETLMVATAVGLAAAVFITPEAALAGTEGTEFDEIWETLRGWMEGVLGRIIAGAMILVGIIAGVVRQSLMAFAVGIGGGIGLYNTPAIVEDILTSTLSHVPGTTDAVITLSNGLM
ncbi:MAG: conjugal transfer protein TraA [Cellvibrionaceae bacterium]|nr:conjugal transfer protein TraA [Cellvibrionaceae bacterium]